MAIFYEKSARTSAAPPPNSFAHFLPIGHIARRTVRFRSQCPATRARARETRFRAITQVGHLNEISFFCGALIFSPPPFAMKKTPPIQPARRQNLPKQGHRRLFSRLKTTRDSCTPDLLYDSWVSILMGLGTLHLKVKSRLCNLLLSKQIKTIKGYLQPL